jgi:transposase
MNMATEAVDMVRKGEHRRLVELGYHRLSGIKCLWRTDQENLSDSQRKRLGEVYTRLLDTGKAWAYKSGDKDLGHRGKPEVATHFFKNWNNRGIHANLEPLKKVARTMKERLPSVVSYCSLGITNAVAEGICNTTRAIRRRVRGYRNRNNFKTAIYFYCGGLNFYPQ